MARKTLTYTVTSEGRDKGKVFSITEMSAHQAERWAARLLFALMNSGIEVPEDVSTMGLAGVAKLGFKALGSIPFELAEPLLDEMFECVKIMPNPSNPNIVRGLVEDDIEEVTTRLILRKEVFGLHVDFFTNAAPFATASSMAAAQQLAV